MNENVPVIVTSGRTANTTGVVRSFGRCGVPVVLLDSYTRSPAKYSRYVAQTLKSQAPGVPGSDFLDVLLDYGRRMNQKAVIIPTGDHEVLELAKHRLELSKFFLFCVADFGVLKSLVDKSLFCRLLGKEGYPHPRTFLPHNSTEAEAFGRNLDFPFLIKPTDSQKFQKHFLRKCFVINSVTDFDQAIQLLEGKDLQVLVQDIIPGDEFYEFSVYFDQTGNPHAVCGWDRLRQFPPRFGNGTFCRNIWRPQAVELGLRFLKGIGFRGLAAVELKRDPRDNQFKMIEINPRTTLQNRLAAACGVDMELTAYHDLLGGSYPPSLRIHRIRESTGSTILQTWYPGCSTGCIENPFRQNVRH